MNQIITGAKLIYNKLLEKQVIDVFMYSGGSIMPLIDCFYKGPINYYINTHEQNCGHAATGYAKSSGKTGVVITTSGPGLTNCITPMLDAQNDSTPLVVLSGQVSQKFIGTSAFQEAPSVALTQPFTKWSYMIKDPNDISSVIDDAFQIAHDGKKGVVHLDLPKCVLTSTINRSSYNDYVLNKKKSYHTNLNYKKNYKLYKDVIKTIKTSNKPILYIGQGCLHAKDELLKLVNIARIPFTTTIHAKGIINDSHELCLDWCGMHGSPAANYSLQEADCIICIGARFDDRTIGNSDKYAPIARKTGKIIHVDIEKTQFGKTIDSNYNVIADSKNFLDYINSNIKTQMSSEDWLYQINYFKNKPGFKHTIPPNSNINVPIVIKTINDITMNSDKLRENTLVSTGVGNHQMMTYQYITGNYPKKIFSSGSLGVMGAGLPYSIGLQIANPDKLVIDIDGDSSFLMTMSDMKTIMEYNLPIKIAIMNDKRQMMVNVWEQLFFENRQTATINKMNPNFKSVAEAFGLKGFCCDNVEDLDSITNDFINYEGPALCEYKVEPEICLPLVKPGSALDDMILFEEYKYDSVNTINMNEIPS